MSEEDAAAEEDVGRARGEAVDAVDERGVEALAAELVDELVVVDLAADLGGDLPWSHLLLVILSLVFVFLLFRFFSLLLHGLFSVFSLSLFPSLVAALLPLSAQPLLCTVNTKVGIVSFRFVSFCPVFSFLSPRALSLSPPNDHAFWLLRIWEVVLCFMFFSFSFSFWEVFLLFLVSYFLEK